MNELHPKHDEIITIINEYRHEYLEYAEDWQDRAMKCHLLDAGEIDWAHKKAHQAKIHLNKLGLARAQFKATVKKGLMKWDDWLKVEAIPNMSSDIMSEYQVKRYLELLLRDEDVKTCIADNLGDGFYENLVCTKVVTRMKEMRGPKGKKYRSPRTKLIRRDIWNYGLDPQTPEIEKKSSLYEFDVVQIMKHELLKLTHDNPKDYSSSKPYIKEQVKMLQGTRGNAMMNEDEHEWTKGNIHNIDPIGRKKMITVCEFYGTILDDDGMPMEYKRKRDGKTITLEDVRITIGDDRYIIEEPTKFEELFEDAESPFVRHRLHRSKQHILGKAPGHPGYEIARILNELTSASADAAMKAASQLMGIVVDSLENPEDVADGITYDTVLKFVEGTDIKSSVVSLTQGSLPPEFFSVQGTLESGFAENIAKTKLGLAGDLPNKQVKATELVQSSGIVQGLEESDLMDVEDIYIEKMIMKIFRQGLRFASQLNDLDLEFIFADDAEKEAKIEAFKKVAKKKNELYEELAYAFRFRARGLRGIAQSLRRQQMMGNIMTQIVAVPPLMDILERRGYDMGVLFDGLLKSAEIDPEELKDEKVAKMAQRRQEARALGEGLMAGRGQQQGSPKGAPQMGMPAQGQTVPGNEGNQ